MAFENLLNNPMHEAKLLELLTSEVQKNFEQIQNTYFFFKLRYLYEKKSEIIWQKTFSTKKDFADFIYDTKFMRAAIMLKYDKGRFEVLCIGFYYSDQFEIWPDRVLNSIARERPLRDVDKAPMPPREVIERGFGEIKHALSTSKSSVPV